MNADTYFIYQTNIYLFIHSVAMYWIIAVIHVLSFACVCVSHLVVFNSLRPNGL